MKVPRVVKAMEYIDDDLINGAITYAPKKKKPAWVKWGAMAACLCLVVVAAIPIINHFNPDGGRGFGNGDATLSEERRSDFTSDIPSDVVAQLGDNVMKAYCTRENDWFLAESIEDYSQVLLDDVIYMIPDDDFEPSHAYTVYGEKDGVLQKSYNGTPPSDAALPYGFAGLSYSLIEERISGIDYTDYIVTYSYRLGMVIVWVQCSDMDMFVTYPTRPDLLGVEVGAIYTLPEMQAKLTDAYNK